MAYALAASLLANGVLAFFLLKRRGKGSSQEFEEYLALKQDLSRFGGGVMEFKRINPQDIFYRSAR